MWKENVGTQGTAQPVTLWKLQINKAEEEICLTGVPLVTPQEAQPVTLWKLQINKAEEEICLTGVPLVTPQENNLSFS